MSISFRVSPNSVDQVAAAISDFETSTGFKDFGQFRIEQAQSYKRKLRGTGGTSGGHGGESYDLVPTRRIEGILPVARAAAWLSVAAHLLRC